MKNTLAENMLRFGPKNLTEAEKQKLSKLTEQTDQLQMSNIALTDAHKNASKPQKIVSSAGAETISFPGLGMPKNGDRAINNGEGVITYIGDGSYMVIGKIGTLENGTVVGPKLSALTFQGRPGAGSGVYASFGSAITNQQLHSVANLPALTARVAKMIGRNDAASWLKQYGNNLITAYKMAQGLGVDTAILNDLTGYNELVNKSILV